MNKTNLPNNLYELRRKSGLSQEEFADRLCVSRQAVSKWERGEAYPDTENLIAISEMFEITIDELLRGNTDVSEKIEHVDITAESDTAQDEEGNSKGIVRKRVNINIGNGIHVHYDSSDDDSDADDDDDDDDDDDELYRGTKLTILNAIPYPIATALAFLTLGLAFNAWYWAWTLFMTIPVYYSLIEAIQKRKFSHFAYPVFVAFIYCLFGMLFSWWHPGWIIFVTIPIYVPVAEAIDKNIRKH